MRGSDAKEIFHDIVGKKHNFRISKPFSTIGVGNKLRNYDLKLFIPYQNDDFDSNSIFEVMIGMRLGKTTTDIYGDKIVTRAQHRKYQEKVRRVRERLEGELDDDAIKLIGMYIDSEVRFEEAPLVDTADDTELDTAVVEAVYAQYTGINLNDYQKALKELLHHIEHEYDIEIGHQKNTHRNVVIQPIYNVPYDSFFDRERMVFRKGIEKEAGKNVSEKEYRNCVESVFYAGEALRYILARENERLLSLLKDFQDNKH